MVGRAHLEGKARIDETRRYSDEEFAVILHRASELAGAGSSEQVSGGGLSLREIQAVAAEAGIDPAAIERAARGLPQERAPTGVERALGGPVRYSRDFTVPGRFTGDVAARVLTAIRSSASQHGEGEASASGVTWSTEGEPSRTFVAVRPQASGARVQVDVDRTGGLLLTGFLNLVAGFVTAGIVGAIVDPASAVVGAAILGGGLTAGLAGARATWSATTRSARARVDAIADSIAEALEAGPSDSGPA